MSLTLISGKVSRTINGSNLTNALSKSVFGNSSFLRNNERDVDKVAGTISALQNTLTDVSNALGMKNNMYVIGRYEETSIGSNGSWLTNRINQIKNSLTSGLTRAVSYWTNGEEQNGVIIDGFDNFKGDISVALPDNPVMYDTSVVDQVVRNPNRISMRVYVDLMHSDDAVQNIMQSVANSFGGLAGTLMNAVTGNTMNRVQKALNDLQWIQENGKPFKVYTPHKVYNSMMIERIVPVNDQKMNEILVADITFKEIIPTQYLGEGGKTTARKTASAPVNAFAKAVGWLKE